MLIGMTIEILLYALLVTMPRNRSWILFILAPAMTSCTGPLFDGASFTTTATSLSFDEC